MLHSLDPVVAFDGDSVYNGQHEDDKNLTTFGLIGIVILALMAYLTYGRIRLNSAPGSHSWEMGFLIGVGCAVCISIWWFRRQKL